jgi:transcriptional regulator with XRE-family HTH domain
MYNGAMETKTLDLNDALKTILEAPGCSQARVERAIGVSPGYLSKIKRGKRNAGAIAASLWLLSKDPVNRIAEAEEMFNPSQSPSPDIWTAIIRPYVACRLEVTIDDILDSALQIRVQERTRREQMRVAAILAELGYARVRVQDADGTRRRVYRREAAIGSAVEPVEFPW